MPRTRKTRTARASVEPFWKIGLYIRLSREDDNEDDSESIINQEKILRDFVDGYFEPGNYVIVDVFADESIILGLGQKVLVLQGFPDLILIFMRSQYKGYWGG